jgi:hypothetical protein
MEENYMEDLIIKERETKEKIVNIINEAQLPAFILKPIIKELYEQLNIWEEQQYRIATENRNNKEMKQEIKEKESKKEEEEAK